MKTKNLNLMLFAILTIMAFSCKKETKETTTPLKQTKNNNQTFSDENYYKNSENPFDNFGQMHNDGLDYLYNHQNSWSTSIDFSLKQLTIDYASTLGYDTAYSDSVITSYCTTLNTYVTNNNSMQSTLNNMVQNWTASPQAKDVMQSLLDSVMNYDDSTNITSLINTIKTIESDNITNNSNINSTEKESLYKVASVLRYSLYYWNTNPQTVWPSNNPPYFLKKLKEWIKDHKAEIKIACADAAVLVLTVSPLGVVSAVLTSISVS